MSDHVFFYLSVWHWSFSSCFFHPPQLNGSANLNQYVALLPLPSRDEDIKAGTKCQVAGWGVTSSGKPSKCLKEATVKIINRKTCSRNYKKQIKITNNMLCAGWNNAFSKSDACQVSGEFARYSGDFFLTAWFFFTLNDIKEHLTMDLTQSVCF